MMPIYRAKKIDSDEYVEGQLVIDSVGQTIIIQDCVVYGDFKADNVWQLGVYNSFNFIVDPTTLAIHFPDMLASDSDRILPNGKKDLRIFASLSKDGKGGDILYWHNMTDEPDCSPSTAIFINNRVECFEEYFCDLDIDAMIVVGVQE